MRPQVWSQVGCCDFGWEGFAVLGDTVLASRGMALVVFLLASIEATKYQSAWLWLQLYLPCVRLVFATHQDVFENSFGDKGGKAGSSPT